MTAKNGKTAMTAKTAATPAAASAEKTGFTLVELLVTVLVLTIGCLAAIQMQAASLKGTNLADNLTSATFLAEAEMERLKSLDASEMAIEAEAGTVTRTGLDRLGRSCVPVGPETCSNHMYTMTVEYFPKLPTSLSTQVDITVAWTDNNGHRTVRYSGAMTYLTF